MITLSTKEMRKLTMGLIATAEFVGAAGGITVSRHWALFAVFMALGIIAFIWTLPALRNINKQIKIGNNAQATR